MASVERLNMMNAFLGTVGKAIKSVNPNEVKEMADRTVTVGLMATTESRLNDMWYWLAPAGIPEAKRQFLASLVHPLGPKLPDMPEPPARLDLEIWEEGMLTPAHAFTFYREDPERTVREILEKYDDLGLPLSRQFVPFRRCVSEKVIHAICNENTTFAVVAALPNVVPSFLSLPFAVGEFASDTAFLTMNQMRMAFLLAGAHDHPIGYLEQKAQIASVIASAFGWRALARELVSKIPFGGGVIGKAAVSYAGTWLVGRGLERIYRTGTVLSSAERKHFYEEGLRRGREIARKLLPAVKK